MIKTIAGLMFFIFGFPVLLFFYAVLTIMAEIKFLKKNPVHSFD